LGATSALAASAPWVWSRAEDTPALLGGRAVRSGRPFPRWPIFGEDDLQALRDVLRSGVWNRQQGSRVASFEEAWKTTLGAQHVLATSSGTTALFAALNALDVGPGDEVIVPPYTFVATINVVLLQHALPVFVDTDPETFQIDARQVESAITPRTACLLPAHIGGAPADLDILLELAQRHRIPLIEDACQSHLAEWRSKKVGTLGTVGCFSFQASKHLNSGEGGALVTNDSRLAETANSFHNNGRAAPGSPFSYVRNGCNLRLTAFQASLLCSQLTRLEPQTRTREQNASFLTELLRDIPGITPARTYEGCTRRVYHLYMFRYDATAFGGLPRATFLKALEAEGIPASPGYSPLNKEPFLAHTLRSKAYRAVYPRERLDDALDRMRCPVNDRLCQQAVWFTQNMLLGDRADMEQIAEAIRKLHKHAGALARA
jgi:dTDP-4-amino-4,6-dideoxygalactose transaminase